VANKNDLVKKVVTRAGGLSFSREAFNSIVGRLRSRALIGASYRSVWIEGDLQYIFDFVRQFFARGDTWD
jgi:hypothetical protein